MRSWLVSALSDKVDKGVMSLDGLERLTRGDWLVWEPGTWRPSRANANTAMGIPQAAIAAGVAGAEALAIALEPNIDRKDVTFGRERCDIVIDDRTLSAHHLSFSFDEHHWWVRDVGSRNGTLLDGRKLGPEPAMLTSGLLIQPAQVVLTYYTTSNFMQRLTRRR